MDIILKRMDYLMMNRPLRRREGFPDQRHLIVPPGMRTMAMNHPVTRGWMPVAAGYFPEARGHLVARDRGLEEIVFIACTAGRGFCEIEGRHLEVPTGAAVILPARRSHRYGASDQHPWSISWLHLRGDEMKAFLQLLRVGPEEPRFHLPGVEAFQDEFDRGYEALHAAQAFPQFALACARFRTLFCGLALRRQSVNPRVRTAEEAVAASPLWMRDHLAEPLSLQDMADSAGLSPSHYAALFRRKFGCSPVEFLLRLKVQEASRLLEQSEATVSAISAQLGYTDPYYFSRLFKKRIGVSPIHHRQRPRG